MGSEIATTKLSYTWILWYHDPQNDDYTINGYIKICDINTTQQFWTIIDNISKEQWECGMFFFMKKGYPPIYEAEENKNGGSWSKKITNTEIIYETFIHLMVRCISNEMLIQRKETLVGVTLSHRDDGSIIRVYNSTTELKDPKVYLNKNIPNFQITDDVSYAENNRRNISNNKNSYKPNNSRRGRR